MKELTSNEINTICKNILIQATEENSFFVPHLHFLYYYGVRIGETIYKHITEIDQYGRLHIYPQKKNTVRKMLIANEDTADMLEQLHIKESHYLHSYKNLQREIKRLNPYGNLRNGNKNIGAHLFRHNYIRKLLHGGMEPWYINTLMGYTTQKVEETYMKGKIYYG